MCYQFIGLPLQLPKTLHHSRKAQDLKHYLILVVVSMNITEVSDYEEIIQGFARRLGCTETRLGVLWNHHCIYYTLLPAGICVLIAALHQTHSSKSICPI